MKLIPVYVSQIKESIYNKCYFPALALALALPDMCGMVEYPNEDVSKRYINWIDKYLGEQFSQKPSVVEGNVPCLTGEVIYNLRNTFLHQGSLNVQNEKIKNEKNKVDKFALVLGDGSVFWEASINFESPKFKEIEFKAIMVDLTYLCECLCNCAQWYYENNKEKFSFDVLIIPQTDIDNIKVDNTSTKIEDVFDSSFASEIANFRFKNIGSHLRTTGVPGTSVFKIEENELNRQF